MLAMFQVTADGIIVRIASWPEEDTTGENRGEKREEENEKRERETPNKTRRNK